MKRLRPAVFPPSERRVLRSVEPAENLRRHARKPSGEPVKLSLTVSERRFTPGDRFVGFTTGGTNDSQREARRRTIEVFEDGAPVGRMLVGFSLV